MRGSTYNQERAIVGGRRDVDSIREASRNSISLLTHELRVTKTNILPCTLLNPMTERVSRSLKTRLSDSSLLRSLIDLASELDLLPLYQEPISEFSRQRSRTEYRATRSRRLLRIQQSTALESTFITMTRSRFFHEVADEYAREDLLNYLTGDIF